MAVKRYAEVNTKRCVSCGACIKQCRLGAIQVWKGCFAVIDKEKCVGCGLCAKECPASAIERREVTQ